MKDIDRLSFRWLVVAATFWAVAPVAALAQNLPDEQRVAELAEMLPPVPRGVGPRIEQRAQWDEAARHEAFRSTVGEAEALLGQTMPELTDELLLDFSRTGNRSRGQRVLSLRHSRLPTLVLAECLENKGRFLPAIEATIEEICGEKMWVLPAHDRSLNNFHGTQIDIDLVSSSMGWQLATTADWLGERLGESTRRLIRKELDRRIFAPYESSLRTGKPRHWWVTGTNNWNSVCLAGVTGTALATLDDVQRRAWYAAAAEKHVQNLFRGFTDDGYCSEGVGYWNYGFGHFALLAETLHQATDGRLDLFAGEKVAPVAQYGRRIEILPGICPSFADCRPASRPAPQLAAFLSRRFDLGLVDAEREALLLADGPSRYLFQTGLFCFDNSASRRPAAAKTTPPQPLRDWFSEAGVLICRPADDADKRLGVAIKGGHNAEHHNHNDVGTFVVALAGDTPLVDPGGEVYTARTFSSKRYTSDVLNSLGHPVPRVAGRLQRTGRAAAAKVLATEFTDTADVLALDLKAAYDVPELMTLKRTFEFSRAGRGKLTVVDEVAFSAPQTFGTALITFSPHEALGDNHWRVGRGDSAVVVDVQCEGGTIQHTAEKIDEDLGGRTAVRFGFDLAEPTAKATIRMVIKPAE